MSVGSATATDLVHQIFDLQRTLRCVVTAHMARVPDVGMAVQGVMRFIGEGRRAPRNWLHALASAPRS